MVAGCNSSRPGRRTSRSAFKGEVPGGDDPLLGFAPYVHKAARRNSITPDRQRAFIAALAASGIVTQAAREIGASLEALYKLRHLPGAEGFAAAWEAAIDRGMERLEDCALERAIVGEERVVVRRGEVVTTWRRFDTGLLIFLLRSRRRGRFEAYVPVRAEARESEAEARRRAIAEEREAEEVLRALDEKLEAMRLRAEAARAAEAGAAQEGDAGLGMPRLTPHQRMVGMIGTAYQRSPCFSPPTDEEIVAAQWRADLEAGRLRKPDEPDGGG